MKDEYFCILNGHMYDFYTHESYRVDYFLTSPANGLIEVTAYMEGTTPPIFHDDSCATIEEAINMLAYYSLLHLSLKNGIVPFCQVCAIR